MVVADRSASVPPPPSGMTCCYNMTHVEVWNILSASPPHVTLTHTVTVSGNVSSGAPIGVTHNAVINITKNAHHISGTGPSVAPNIQINFSQTLFMDSNTDTCLLDGSLCNGGSDIAGATGSDEGDIFCSYLLSDVYSVSISSQEEAAFTQVFWPGESVIAATCTPQGACDYPVLPDCTIDTSPPDNLVPGISGGDYRTLAPNGVTWRTLAGCVRFIVTGGIFNFKTQWRCSPGLAFFVSFNGQAPPYACTHTPSHGGEEREGEKKMLLKLSKLFAIAVGAFFSIGALFIIRFWVLARAAQERTGARNVAVDVYLLVHSPWLILGIVVVVVLAGWISYRYIFKS